MRIHCRFCGLPHELDITPEQLMMFTFTRDATRSFPNVNRDHRELFITGMCDFCFAETFDESMDDKPHTQRVWTKESVISIARSGMDVITQGAINPEYETELETLWNTLMPEYVPKCDDESNND